MEFCVSLSFLTPEVAPQISLNGTPFIGICNEVSQNPPLTYTLLYMSNIHMVIYAMVGICKQMFSCICTI